MLPITYAIRNLLREPSRTVQKVLGSVLVIFLMLAASAFNAGMSDLLRASGAKDNIIFLGAGSEESVERSQISMQSESMIQAGISGIEERAGITAVSGEVHYNGLLSTEKGIDAQGLTRGVTAAAFEIHREVRIIEGRWPNSGEVLVGRLAHHLLNVSKSDLAIGNEIYLENEPFRIAGLFDARGTVMESEVWFNRSDLMAVVQRETLSCVVVKSSDPNAMEKADLFAKQRLDLELVAIPETEYYASLAAFYGPIRSMTWLTAVMVSIGAIMGGFNMLYASFSSRIGELATLQTLGYQRLAVLFSLIQENLLTQAVGLLIALFVSLVVLDGTVVQFSMGTFSMELSGGVILTGLLTALILGTIGTLPPAIRCLRLPVPVALRSA